MRHKKNKKLGKLPCCALLLLIISAILAGCSAGPGDAPVKENSKGALPPEASIGAFGEAQEPYKIVTTIFPPYDWLREIIGDDVAQMELTLLGEGVDLHSYEPTVDDMITISSCDLFIYVGGESDQWVQDALDSDAGEEMIVINLLEVLGDQIKEEEIIEGMKPERGEEGEDTDFIGNVESQNGRREEITAPDEHVWLSLKNARILVQYISKQLGNLDPVNAEIYDQNAAAYDEKLAALDAEYQGMIDSAPGDTLLFADRFPFRYLVDDYDLNYYAAFAGCSAETEASFETIVFLAEQLDARQLQYVIIIDTSDRALADTIIQSTADGNQEVLILDSMQSVNAAEVSGGITYLSVMQKNLDVLREALGGDPRDEMPA